MKTWKDYAPAIGTGVGAVGLGALLAMVGDRKKRMRNALIGAILGGASGYAFGSGIEANNGLYNSLQEKDRKNKDLGDRLRRTSDVMDKFDTAARYIGIRGGDGADRMSDAEARADALMQISQMGNVHTVGSVMDDESADKARSAIRIPEDAKTFETYHLLASSLGPNGKFAFLPIHRDFITQKKLKNGVITRDSFAH